MSKNIIKDVNKLQSKGGVKEWVKDNPELLPDYLKFRVSLLQEELREAIDAVDGNNNEEVVDAMVDIAVIALGTLTNFGVDAQKAWDEVHKANMTKEVGIKPERPNKLGLPDFVKPKGWKGPSHIGNHGLLSNFVNKKYTPRHAVKVLEECADLMKLKSEDYNHISQIDYYPNGLQDIWYMLHTKVTRIRSVLAKGSDTNFESAQDSARDLINYSAFFVEYSEGKMDGQPSCK